MDTKILIVDDDPYICEAFQVNLETEGYQVKIANDGVEAVNLFKLYNPDLVLLDLMLPKKEGREVCREMHEISPHTPIIVVSAKDNPVDKVVAFELGAEDFVVKPVEKSELLARIKVRLRGSQARVKPADEEAIKFENMEVSLQKYELKINGVPVPVPPKELELLYFLASNSNHVFKRDQLLDKVWGFDYLGDSRTVDVHVKRLREKLEGVSDRWALKTVWGVGYKFETYN
ncbi:MAG: response regulator transcription factor [Ruminococcaceae bacterium]|nr:response regulator transcription factor [Oscillospiraceae bacterium]